MNDEHLFSAEVTSGYLCLNSLRFGTDWFVLRNQIEIICEDRATNLQFANFLALFALINAAKLAVFLRDSLN